MQSGYAWLKFRLGSCGYYKDCFPKILARSAQGSGYVFWDLEFLVMWGVKPPDCFLLLFILYIRRGKEEILPERGNYTGIYTFYTQSQDLCVESQLYAISSPLSTGYRWPSYVSLAFQIVFIIVVNH